FTGLLWGEANQDSVSHAARFLLIPFLIPLFTELKTRRYALWGFLSAMVLTLTLSYLAWFGLLPYNNLFRSTTSSYFGLHQFRDGLTIERLCRRIGADMGNIALISPDNTTGRLNDILKIPDFYDRLRMRKNDILYSAEVAYLVSETSGYRTVREFSYLTAAKQEKVLTLNRLVLEETYPDETPKSSREKSVDVSVIQHKITHNFLMAMAAFLLAVRIRFTKGHATKALLTMLTGLVLFNLLFMVGGKTGYVVLLVLMVYFFIDWLRFKRGVIAASFVLVLLAAVVFMFPSSQLYTRTVSIFDQLSRWHPERADESSVGQRLEFYNNSLKIIRGNPFLGVGTGNFTIAYARAVEGTQMDRTDNPHNEYLMTAVQLGLVGLVALLYMFFTQWRFGGKIYHPEERIMARGLVLAIVVGCLFNSFLRDYTEGLLYFWMSAVLFSSLTGSSTLSR
ncbi:MAG: O-antigen ligase family protein, partial [Deltaproteobacteria bacterium]|nr:O-antigen ligase family protein [Deltaproteobacteria bacterium]